MNLHVTTPTAAKAIDRHRSFHQSIERKAAALRSSKLVDAMRSQHTPFAPFEPVSPHALPPEAIPAEPDPPVIPISLCNRINIIQRLTCEIFGNINLLEIRSGRKNRDLCAARQIAMYLCKKYTTHSFPTIGRMFGGKDHTTVLHACRRVETMLVMTPGSGWGVQTPPAHCDMVRQKTFLIRAALLELLPEIGAEA